MQVKLFLTGNQTGSGAIKQGCLGHTEALSASSVVPNRIRGVVFFNYGLTKKAMPAQNSQIDIN